MTQKPAHQIRVNLNPKAKPPIGNLMYTWAINIGRLLILFTEIVALGALFYRFVIDQQIVDLHDKINQDKGWVIAQAKQEATFRGIQDRLNIVSQVQKGTDLKMRLINDILQAGNNGSFYSSQLSIDQSSLTLNATTPQITILYNYIEKLKQYPEVQAITIDNIGSSPQGITFQMTIELKENQALTNL